MKTIRYLKMVAAFVLMLCFMLPSFVFAEDNGFFAVSLDSLSDEQLEEAAAAVRAEQRARIKTKIVLDKDDITMIVGKNDKIIGNIEELPEGEKAPKLDWSTSDKSIVTVNNGQIRAVAGGNAVVTCGANLSDGTYIYSECKVTVNVPITSLGVDKKTLDLTAGDSFSPTFSFKPDNASETGLVFESSNPDVASVTENGVITGVASGKATITVKTIDGSGKSVVISVNVKNDGYMKNMKGEDLYNKVISGERASNKVEGGSSDWYDRGADINGISFEVHSYGKNGQVVSVEVLDIMSTGNKDIFFKVLDNLFSGDDLKKATDWVKKNLGRNGQLQVGDAYIILQQTTNKAPIMYIQDEEHKDWV